MISFGNSYFIEPLLTKTKTQITLFSEANNHPVGKKENIYWKGYKQSEWFCRKCGIGLKTGDLGYEKTFRKYCQCDYGHGHDGNRKKTQIANENFTSEEWKARPERTFHSYLGLVEITEVLEATIFKKNGVFTLITYKDTPEEIARQEGFKTLNYYYTHLAECHSLDQPTKIKLVRWKWIERRMEYGQQVFD